MAEGDSNISPSEFMQSEVDSIDAAEERGDGRDERPDAQVWLEGRLARADRLEAAWRESEEELDWIADVDESGIEQATAERIAKDVIERFRAALGSTPEEET